MLTLVDDDTVGAVRIEGPVGVEQVDAVDFDVVDTNGQVRLAAQVKSVTPGRRASAATVFGQLVDLIRGHDAAGYQVLTNAHPEPSAVTLADALASATDPGELYAKLRVVLGNAPARLTQLDDFNAVHLQRLCRADILFDARDDIELRESLREAMRIYRNRARAGLGMQSAGLLTGDLVAEILARAADATRSVFTMAQFRGRLLISGDALAFASGARDWGVLIGAMPPIPDVARPVLLDQLGGALHQPDHRRPAVAVLTGPSGIGKSSLAAGYLADRADSYDLIVWIDGDTRQALVAGFERVLSYLRTGEPTAGTCLAPVEIRAAVHTELVRYPGRWALVIDNVVDIRDTQPWIPSLGSGHVILTTLDATARLRTVTPISVDVMEADEAVTLLTSRLHLSPGAPPRRELDRLAAGLSYYPLALELAAGYMDSCGITNDAADVYLQRLKIRILSDEDSVPDGYPHTLVAAIALCMQQLQRRVAAGRKSALLAYGMLGYAVYLSSRQIPVDLLAAAVMIDPNDTGYHIGPLMVDPSDGITGEAVRDLRRHSFVTYDVDLPQMRTANPVDSSRTISVNSIIQDIVRATLPHTDSTAAAFDQLANHVERWLSAATQLNLLHRADIIFTHAEALVRHLRPTGIATERISLLLGNVAAALRVRNNLEAAQDLLLAEIDTLHHSPTFNELIVVQAELNLAEIALHEPERACTSTVDVIRYLEHALVYAQTIASESQPAVVRLFHLMSHLLDTPTATALAVENGTVQAIRTVCVDMLRILGPSPYTEAVQAVFTANQAMSAADPATAEQLCRDVLRTGILLSRDELVAQRILVEALAAQHRWPEATEVLGGMQASFGTGGIHHDIVSDMAHNTGMECAFAILTNTDAPAAAALLKNLVEWPPVRLAHQHLSTGYQARLRLLTALSSLAHGDRDSAQQYIDQNPATAILDGPSTESDAWVLLWQQLRLATVRMGEQAGSHHPAVHTPTSPERERAGRPLGSGHDVPDPASQAAVPHDAQGDDPWAGSAGGSDPAAQHISPPVAPTKAADSHPPVAGGKSVGKGGNRRKRKQPVRRPIPAARLRAERRTAPRPGFTEQDLTAGWVLGPEVRIRLAREDDMAAVAALCTLADLHLEREVTEAVDAGVAGAAIRAFARGGKDGFTRHIAEQFFLHQGSNREVPFQHVTLILVAEHAQHGVVGAAVAYPPMGVIQQLLRHIRRTGGAAQQQTQVVLIGAIGIARIKALAVRGEMRGAGLGTALLQRCLQIYDDCGYMIVYGQSPDAPGLDRFYRSQGFDVLAPGAGFDAWVVFGEHVEIRPDPTERTFLWHRPPQGQQRRTVPAPRTVTTSEITPGTAAGHTDPHLPAFEVSGLVTALAKCPVDVVPLYAVLAVVHQAMSGAPVNACVPVCYQIAAALGHLGFETEVMAAYVEVIQGDITHVSLGVRGPATVRMDYTTNGHTVLWAASFGRLVDPTITQHPALLAAAHTGQTNTPPHWPYRSTAVETHCYAAPLAPSAPRFQINYLVQPQYTPAFNPWLAEFRDAVEHGGLGLAHLTLDTITATCKVRDLRELSQLYPPLGALLDGQKHLPILPQQPPASWTRLSGPSRVIP